MLRIYKSGNVELTGETFAVKGEVPKPAHMASYAEGQGPQEELLLSDEGPVILDPQAVEDIFRDAEEQAAKIITDARRKTEEESQIARMNAQQEAIGIRNEAYLEGQSSGFAEGAAAKVTEIEQCVSRLEQAVAEIEGQVSGFVAEYESNLKWAVAEVSSKVLGRIIERDEVELVELVKDAVDQVKNSEWIDLHLCRESTDLIERLQRELAPLRQLDIVPSDLPPGSCLLDIPSGKLDASIDTQMDNLKEYFRSHTLEL